MTARLFFKLIVGTLSVLIVALVAVDILVSQIAESNYREGLERELGEKGRMLALLTSREDPETIRTHAREIAATAGARFTLVSSDGSVLAESERDSREMENHRTQGRPEVMAALQGIQGATVRKSGTLGSAYLYVAVPSRQGALRLSVPLSDVSAKVDAIRGRMLASTALAFLPAFVVAAFFARSVSTKLGRIIDYAGKLADGNFQARLQRPGSDELGQLGQKLNETGEKLEKMMETVQREHQELEKVERVRKDFVINVSHELRTPLASIQGYTETLLDGAINEPGTNVRFLNIIRQNAERLTNLASDLLTLSRIELKSQKFQFASYYVNDLLTDCTDSVRPLAGRKHVTIRMVPAPASAEVFCDSKAVHQLLGNLLDNAIKYTPENSEIEAGARALPPDAPGREFVEFWVKDTGVGIPAEELPRLFERFYRVDKARSRELGGTGLGLSIVKHLARSHGGDVGVTSEVGRGSRFWFTLPVQDLGLPAEPELQGQLTAT